MLPVGALAWKYVGSPVSRFRVNAAAAQLALRREECVSSFAELLEERICCVFRKPGVATSHAAYPTAHSLGTRATAPERRESGTAEDQRPGPLLQA